MRGPVDQGLGWGECGRGSEERERHRRRGSCDCRLGRFDCDVASRTGIGAMGARETMSREKLNSLHAAMSKAYKEHGGHKKANNKQQVSKANLAKAMVTSYG